MSEAAGISESHLKKIEAGVRQPGIQTYQRMIAVLEADIVIKDMTRSIKGDCAARAQKVFLESTEAQAALPGDPVYSGPHRGRGNKKPCRVVCCVYVQHGIRHGVWEITSGRKEEKITDF